MPTLYKDLHLEKLYETLPLNLAHYNHGDSCTCCSTEDDFPKKLWKDQTKVPFSDPNCNYLLFKIAHNIGTFNGIHDIPLPKDNDTLCMHQSPYHDTPTYYDVMVQYGGPFFAHRTRLRRVLKELQKCVGDDYRIFMPLNKSFCAVILHKNDTRAVKQYLNDEKYRLIKP